MAQEENESVEVEMPSHLQSAFIMEEDTPFDIYVEYDGASRIFEINETDMGLDHVAYRNFTIDGGVPPEMLDDNVVEAISGKLGLHMQSISNIV